MVTWSIRMYVYMYTFLVESVLWGYYKYKDNWLEESNFASASARGQRYFKIDIFAPKFAPQISIHVHANIYPEVKSFLINGDKFGWVKYWRITFNSLNVPKFSLVTILCYTALHICMCYMITYIHTHHGQFDLLVFLHQDHHHHHLSLVLRQNRKLWNIYKIYTSL